MKITRPIMNKIYLPILCFLIIGSSLNAQLFSEQSATIGINHSFNPRGLMGGGAAFFDYENDGDDDFLHHRRIEQG